MAFVSGTRINNPNHGIIWNTLSLGYLTATENPLKFSTSDFFTSKMLHCHTNSLPLPIFILYGAKGS